jgi:outer membrane protein assembly factor BamB
VKRLNVMASRVILAGCALAGAAPLHGQEKTTDWPRFRGPGGCGTSGNMGLPLTWSADENVLWRTALPGPGASSPILVGEKVFLTCYSGYNVPGAGQGEMGQLKLHVVCANRDNGKILWDCEVVPRLPEQARIRETHGYASSTPVAEGDRLYVFFGKSGVFAFDLEGNQLWRGDVGSDLHGWGSAASPIVHEGRLYWMHESRGIAYCAQAMTGSIVYEQQIERAGQIYVSPVLADGRLYYLSRTGRTYVLPAVAKYELLAVNDLGDPSMFNASPAVADNRLLIRSDKFLYCLGLP